MQTYNLLDQFLALFLLWTNDEIHFETDIICAIILEHQVHDQMWYFKTPYIWLIPHDKIRILTGKIDILLW
jgi:hypothetical protein